MAGKRRCWKCKKVAEAKEMRYDILGRDLICPDCLSVEKRGNVGKERETATVTKTATTNKFQPGNIKDSGSSVYDDSMTISYQCGSCGLGFSEKKGARVRQCPYCGKGNFRIAVRDSAPQVIEESAREKFED